MQRALLGILIGMGVSSPASADRGVELHHFLRQVYANHPFFDQQEMNAQIAEQQQRAYAGAEDWVVVANPGYQYRERSAGNGFFAEKDAQFGARAGVEREFWADGSRLALNYDYHYLDQQYPSSLNTLEEHSHGLNLSYSLPLLKNRGGVLSRLAYELQAYEVDVAAIQADEVQEDFLAQRALAYLDWVWLHEQYRIANNRLLLAEEELQRSQQKRRARLAAEVDVLRAQDAVITAQQARQRIAAQHQALQIWLATESGDETLPQATPAFDLYRTDAPPSLDEVLATMTIESRLLKAIDLRLGQAQQELDGLENQTRPELDLVLGAGLASEHPDFNDSYDLDQPQYSIGFNFRYPLGQRTAKADVSRARLQQQQLRQQRANVLLQLAAQMRQLHAQMTVLLDVLALNQRQIDIAKQKTEEELRLHNQGRSELTFVIQSRDNEQNAQLAYAENAATYQRLWLQYQSLSDRLLGDVRGLQGE